MPLGSPVPFTSFTTLLHVEDVLRLQVPATDPTAFDACPSNAGGRSPFISVDGLELTIYFVHHFHFSFTVYESLTLTASTKHLFLQSFSLIFDAHFAYKAHRHDPL